MFQGRVYLLQDNEEESSIVALDAQTGKQVWRTPRAATGFPKSSWMTPFIWKNALRTEIVTTGHGFVISYDLNGRELWRVGGMSMPTPSPLLGGRPALRRHRRAGGCEPAVPRDQAGRERRHLAEAGYAQQRIHRLVESRAPRATRRPRSCTTAARTSCTIPGS